MDLLDRVSALSDEVAQSDWRMRIGNKMENFREALVEDQQETTIIESRAADLKDRMKVLKEKMKALNSKSAEDE